MEGKEKDPKKKLKKKNTSIYLIFLYLPLDISQRILELLDRWIESRRLGHVYL